MAKNNKKLRSVDTHFWEDTYVDELDPVEKLLFLYLLTNQNSNLAGIYEITLKKISYQTGIERDMVVKIFSRFASANKAFFVGGYVIIPNYSKHQNYNKTTMKSAVSKILEELPKNIIDFLFSLENKQIFKLFEFAAYPIPNLSLPYGEKEDENERETEGEGKNETSRNREIPSDNLSEISEDEIQRLWIRTFGRNPKLPEREETMRLVENYGFEKIEKVFREAALRHVKSLRYILDNLQPDGTLGNPWERGRASPEERKETIIDMDYED